MTAHRYWRVYGRINAGDGSFTGVTEIEMAESAAGSDVTSTTFATSSGSFQAGSASSAFNNDFTGDVAQWNGTGADKWLGQDFGAGNEKDIIEVRIRPNKDAANRTFAAFDIQYSDDGTNYTTLWSVRYTGWSVGTTVTFSKPGSGPAYRYWRTKFSNCMSNVYTVAELTMAIALGGSNQCSGGTGLASSGTIGSALDANTSTFWSSSTTGNYEYIGYDFGSGVTKQIIEISLLSRQDNTPFFQQWPRTIMVEAGSDGINWLPIWTVNNSLQTYTDGAYVCRNPAAISPGSTHRWWGIRPTTFQSGTVFGLREVEFRASLGGADLTTGGAGGSIYPFDQTTFGGKGYDSTTAEYSSASGQGANDVLAYDYGNGNEKAAPAQIALTARGNTGFNEQNQAPTAFDLVYSDDGFTWSLQEAFTTPATWTGTEQRLFALTPGSSSWVPQAILC